MDGRFDFAHELFHPLKLNSAVRGSYPQSILGPHSFIYVHPFNTYARHHARCCVPDDTMYAVSFTVLVIWLISVLFLGVDPVFEFYLLKSTGCQPDGLPLPYISQAAA